MHLAFFSRCILGAQLEGCVDGHWVDALAEEAATAETAEVAADDEPEDVPSPFWATVGGK